MIGPCPEFPYKQDVISEHSIKEIQLENGAKYHGQVNGNNQRQGYGILVQNGDIYEGGFQSDLKHGKGWLTYSSGDQYEGDF